jgi:hypothetical protein
MLGHQGREQRRTLLWCAAAGLLGLDQFPHPPLLSWLMPS